MRENRQSGSEGGEPQTNAAFLPLSLPLVRKPPDPGIHLRHLLSQDGFVDRIRTRLDNFDAFIGRFIPSFAAVFA